MKQGFVIYTNNGVVAVVREVDALKRQNLPGSDLHNPDAPIFTFTDQERYQECISKGVSVYTGTIDHLKTLVGDNWRDYPYPNYSRFRDVLQWTGFVPFSNGVMNLDCNEDWWIRELSYRTVPYDVARVFFDGDIERYYKEFLKP